ncbi:hypothetical protein D9757_001500 [Collybiopsis confluens]|uniref:G-protein coupled receptors family 2 profile 2 domain-containing protein n=1 Tax=Collybiopsis confluens TaxID=2823264 RepID=A0A8H5HZT1_9AGAR|nr:hypothetical protein D9757_001500 [Collybiopsis confluens]
MTLFTGHQMIGNNPRTGDGENQPRPVPLRFLSRKFLDADRRWTTISSNPAPSLDLLDKWTAKLVLATAAVKEAFLPIPPNEMAGAIVVNAFAILSTLALFCIFLRVSWLGILRLLGEDVAQSFFNTQLGYYAACLLVANMINGVAGLMGLPFLINRGITDTAVMQLGNVSTAYFTVAIAFHTFNSLVLRKRQSVYVYGPTILVGWTVSLALALIPLIPSMGAVYGPSGLACGVRASLPRHMFFFHLLPIFAAAALSAILYTLIFLVLRGMIAIKGGLRITLNPEERWRDQSNSAYQRFVASIARSVVDALLLFNTFRILGPAFQGKGSGSGYQANDLESFGTAETFKRLTSETTDPMRRKLTEGMIKEYREMDPSTTTISTYNPDSVVSYPDRAAHRSTSLDVQRQISPVSILNQSIVVESSGSMISAHPPVRLPTTDHTRQQSESSMSSLPVPPRRTPTPTLSRLLVDPPARTTSSHNPPLMRPAPTQSSFSPRNVPLFTPTHYEAKTPISRSSVASSMSGDLDVAGWRAGQTGEGYLPASATQANQPMLSAVKPTFPTSVSPADPLAGSRARLRPLLLASVERTVSDVEAANDNSLFGTLSLSSMSTQDSPATTTALAADTVGASESPIRTDLTVTVEDTPSSPQVKSPKSSSPRSPRPKFNGFKRFKQLAKFKGHNKEFLIAHPLAASPVAEMPAVSEKASLMARSEDALADSNGDGDGEDDDDPNLLAEKIRQLISSLPAVNHPSSGNPAEPTPAPSHGSPEHDPSSCPLPPPSAVHIKDKHLLQLLSDPIVMNGRKEEWPTVWSILTSLSPPSKYHEGIENDTTGVGSGGGNSEADTANPGAVSIGPSVMVYIPLEPEDNDQVELARSVLVPVISRSSSAVLGINAWKWWPFPSKKGQVSEPTTPPTPGTPPPPPKKVWIPSNTKISIMATWWGYRIFLPPPVIKILDNKEVEAAKRAAMISSALVWFFVHLPISMFPPPMQPMILVLQKIIPYITYIGTFISWSWSQIKSYDIGYGVILNATWLLPVALLPGTWRADQFPGTPPPIQNPSPGPSAPSTKPGTPSAPSITPNGPAPVTATPLPSTQPVQASSEPSDTKPHALSIPTIELVDCSNKPSEITDADKFIPLSPPSPAPLSPSLASPTKFVEALDENKEVIASFAAAVAAVRSLTPALSTNADARAETEVVVTKQPAEPKEEEAPTSTGLETADTQTANVPAAATKSDVVLDVPALTAEEVQEDNPKSAEEEMRERPSSPVVAVWKYITG